MNLPHLAQRLFNTPLALHPRKAEVVMAALGERFRHHTDYARKGLMGWR